MPIPFEIIGTCVSIQNINVHEVLSDSHKYFKLASYIFFIHIYDPLSIPCLAVIFIFANSYEVLPAIHKYFTFHSYSCSFPCIKTHVFLLWQTYFFFLINASNFQHYSHV